MSWNRIALSLIVLNIVASTWHCLDNIIFFKDYPEPNWISSYHIVDYLYFVALGLLIGGYVAFIRRNRIISAIGMILFTIISVSALGHYLYAPMSSLTLKMNILIILEAISAIILIGFVVWTQILWRKSVMTSQN